MKTVSAALLLVLAFTTGFTCSKTTPPADAPAADAAPAATDTPAEGAPADAGAPAAEPTPATETK